MARQIFLISMIVCFTWGQSLSADPASLIRSLATTPELVDLITEYDTTRFRFEESLSQASDASARERLASEIQSAQTRFSRRFLQLAQKSEDSRVAVRAAVWILVNDRHASQETADALQQLARLKDHEDLADVVGVTSKWPPSRALDEFFATIGTSSNPTVRLHAKYAQALHGMAALDAAHQLRGYEQRKQDALLEVARRELGTQAVSQLLTHDDGEAKRRVESLLNEVIQNAREIPSVRGSLADTARADLFELKNLAIGQRAPEISGVDLTGAPMKLSNFRGNVVLLGFWGSWCPQCMQLLPQERAIAEALSGQPFVQLGVNNDDDVAAAQKAVEREEMTWRSWRDGNRTSGKIASQWNVKEWPTFYVIDADGIIRHKIRGVEANGLSTSIALRIDELIHSMASDKVSTRAWWLFGGGVVLTGFALVRAALQRTPGGTKIRHALK